MSPTPMPAAEDVMRRFQMLEMIVENTSNMVVVTDEERRITWVNAAYSRITGWRLDECVGRRPADLLHGPQTSALSLSRLGAMVRQGQAVRDFELLNYKRSGEPYWVSLNIEPIRDAAGQLSSYVSIQTDITERKKRELLTADLQHRLELAQRLARLGRIEHDEDTGRSRWTSEIYRILGCERDEEARGVQAFMAHAHEQDRPMLQAALDAALRSGDEIDVEFRVVTATGACRWVRCRGVPHVGSNAVELPLTFSVQDVTLYKNLIEQRHRRNEDLNQQVLMRTRQLEEAYGSLEEFSYALSHDLRTPLRHIAGFAELLKEEVSAGDVQGSLPYCDKIIRAAVQMRHLIDGMLSFARLGRKGMKVGAVDMAALVDETVTALAIDAGMKKLRWRIQPGLPTVQGDPVLLREVWVNLLDNAVKYASHREVIEIEVGWRALPDGTEFHVSDNGVGFEPGQAERLFGMFQRLHSDPRFEGAGIGLALVRRIVEYHGGRIWADACPDQGASFHVFLPLTVAPDVPDEAHRRPEDAPPVGRSA
ncbi:MAG: PAS domain S-box protein [Hydrogenophaga sp.]|uniref:sensor histidine kinase n=1 Tax=Hydrogenophaga sp. TaxID=1904254 RepID=UPI0025BAEE2C|nr:ATP-binding protein [Hydrogenophaga sp.]MBU7573643.1 PAS domain S-box protein [Hydrogenophaga sp.]